MNEITTEQRAYFAGLLDGEGCVSVSKSYPHGDVTYGLRVTFNITYANVLYEMKSIFGGNIHKRDMSKRLNQPCIIKRTEHGIDNPEKWKQSYDYYLQSKEAWVFLKIIEPYCKEKREQVKTAIEFFNGNRTHTGRKKSESQIERCEYYYKKLKELKHEKNEENEIEIIDNQTKINFFSEV